MNSVQTASDGTGGSGKSGWGVVCDAPGDTIDFVHFKKCLLSNNRRHGSGLSNSVLELMCIASRHKNNNNNRRVQ